MRHVLPSTTAVTSTVRQPAYFCQGSGAVKSGGGRPGLPAIPHKPDGNRQVYEACGRKAALNLTSLKLKSCVKVEVAVLGSRPSLISLTVSVDVKQH